MKLGRRLVLSACSLLKSRPLSSIQSNFSSNIKVKNNYLATKQQYQHVRLYSKDLPKHRIINMPALSPTMTQGNIGGWKKKIGDAVTPGDVLVEIETDKAQMELECQEDGYLAKILLPEGTKEALVGKPLAILVNKKADIEKFKDFVLPTTDAASETSGSDVANAEIKEAESQPTLAAVADIVKEEQPTPRATPQTQSSGRVAASPLARNMAKQMGVDLTGIAGSGPNGRIIKDDVTKASASVSTSLAATTKAGFIDMPLSNMRKIIAQRLCESKQNIPHYYITVDVNMGTIIKLREKINQRGAGRYKISINDFIIKASARALKDVPTVNSAWHGTFIRQYESADISVAVATEAGLITPIIANAEVKGLQAISAEMRDFAAKAKENKLRPEQFQGGSFTISNLGMFGVKHFTAIINPPQSCILAVGGTERRLIPDAEGKPITADMMTVTMSCDHRVVDGATGALWLQHFKKYMEDPMLILL